MATKAILHSLVIYVYGVLAHPQNAWNLRTSFDAAWGWQFMRFWLGMYKTYLWGFITCGMVTDKGNLPRNEGTGLWPVEFGGRYLAGTKTSPNHCKGGRNTMHINNACGKKKPGSVSHVWCTCVIQWAHYCVAIVHYIVYLFIFIKIWRSWVQKLEQCSKNG